MTVKVKQRTAVGLLAVLAVVAAALLAVFGLPYGASNPEAFAHLYTHPATSNATHLHIDADLADGFCTAPYDKTVAVGTVHSVGVCLETYDANSVNNFELRVFYNGDPSDNDPPVLNLATELSTAAPALDDNPDANDGAGADKLGTGWDCTGLGLAFPVGDDPLTTSVADAFIVCNANLAAPVQDLADDPGLLATIEFTAQAAGVDVMNFGPADVTNTTNVQNPRPGGLPARCGTGVAADVIGCFGATIHKQGEGGPVPTPAGTPAATATPGGTPATGPAATPTPLPPGMEAIDLAVGCNPVTNTYPDNTPVQTIASSVGPTGTLTSLWQFELGTWLGYSPEFPEVSNLQEMGFLDVVFICVAGPGAFGRPVV